MAPATIPDRPRLREGIRAEPGGTAGMLLIDSLRLSDAALSLSPAALTLAALCDGSRALDAIRDEAAARGLNVSTSQVAEFVQHLDQAGFLDGAAFRAYLNGPVRKPSCIGCYPADPAGIRTTLDHLFTAAGGAGIPGTEGSPLTPPPGRLRAVLVPHMDYARGGVTYGWGFRELIEHTTARLFVIIATSHYSTNRFSLTRMHFETPLGVVETDCAFVERIAAVYGQAVFADPIAHLPEHSIELEVVLLQHLLAERGPFRIVPLLVGSFHDCIESETDPAESADIRRMLEALRLAEAAAGEEVCYLISGDLAHIGPKFRDPEPVLEPHLTISRRKDEQILDRLTAADPAGYFSTIATEQDERRICGLPPTWLTLSLLRPQLGRVLHYQQYVHPTGHESVSFAAAAFYCT